jgi:hypothetical protein
MRLARLRLNVVAAALAAWGGAMALAPGVAQAQQPPGSIPPPPAICQRLEADLARIDRGDDAGRGTEVARLEQAIGRQQQELDRTIAQGQRLGCDRGSGFLIFGPPRPPQCGELDQRIGQMRQNIGQMMSQVQRMSGGGDRDGMRRQVLIALATNNCGPQYRIVRREVETRPRNFFEMLFGGPGGGSREEIDVVEVPKSNTFRTVCVRTCDGGFFPISHSTVPSRFKDDEQLCRNLCPNAETQLFSFRTVGEELSNATSVNGQPYTALPNAFRFRTEFNPACTCKRADQTWADALAHLEDRTVQRGDVIVTEEKSRAMQRQPETRPDARTDQRGNTRDRQAGRNDPARASDAPPASGALPVLPATAPPVVETPPQPPAEAQQPSGPRQIRIVGPRFEPAQQ